MSTTAAAPPTRHPVAPPPARTRPSFLGILRGELIKLLSLRSTWWMLAATVVLITLVSLAVAWSLDAMAANPLTAPELARTNGAELVSGGFQMGMVTIAVLGSLLITGEYSTGMIRSTLAAVPTRTPVLVAKAIALAALTTVISVLSIALSYLVTMPLLGRYHLVPALDDMDTWLTFGGTVYFLIAAGLFALGVGTLLRSSAGTITAALLVLLVLPGVLSFINLDWVQTIADYLPLPASSAFLGSGSPSAAGAAMAPVTGILVIALYAVVPLVVGALVLRRRDA
jgi:ABC-2 type transport system permease protein